MTRTPRRLALGGLILTGGLMLTGCQTDPGAAATVGSDTITTGHLAAVTTRALDNQTLAAKVGGQRAAFERQELERLIQTRLLEQVAARHGVTVSQGEADQQMAQFVQQAGGRAQLEQQAAAAGIPPQDLPGFIRDLVLQNKLAAELSGGAPQDQSSQQQAQQKLAQALVQEAHREGVRVNPRFGSWSPQRLALAAPSSDVVHPTSGASGQSGS